MPRTRSTHGSAASWWTLVPAALLLALAPHTRREPLQGTTFALRRDGSIGPTLANVALSFVREDGSAARRVDSDADGHYAIALDAGRYRVLATHRAYEDYCSAPGFVVVSDDHAAPADFFLREPQLTTVLLVRHGEKQNPQSNAAVEPLSAAGRLRAERLCEHLRDAGVTAVYSTDKVRTRATVAPLAATMRLPTQTYADATALATDILAEHRGDIVLVAAHSDSVATVANAFGARLPAQTIGDFDNLYVVSLDDTTSQVVNLQYAADSEPDLTWNDARAMTLLLVDTRISEHGALELLHAARKADVTALYASDASTRGLAPLATALAMSPTPFDGSDSEAFATQLLSTHDRDTVVVAATHDELCALLRALQGYPHPVLRPDDTEHLIVLTHMPSGASRVVQLRL